MHEEKLFYICNFRNYTMVFIIFLLFVVVYWLLGFLKTISFRKNVQRGIEYVSTHICFYLPVIYFETKYILIFLIPTSIIGFLYLPTLSIAIFFNNEKKILLSRHSLICSNLECTCPWEWATLIRSDYEEMCAIL